MKALLPMLLAVTAAIALGAPAMASATEPVPAPALVMTVNFVVGGTTPVSTADVSVSQLANTISNSVNPWFKRVSNGAFPGYAPTRRGAMNIRTTLSVCSRQWQYEVAFLADTQARRQGVEPRDFNAVFYYFRNIPACPWAGKAEFPGDGNRIWLNGGSVPNVGPTLHTVVHEIGHHLDLGHAGTQFCTDGHGHDLAFNAPFDTRCTQREYGNLYSTMGSEAAVAGAPSFSSAELAKLGWNTGRVQTIQAGGPPVTKTLIQLEHTPVTGDTVALRLVDGQTTFWVEYRADPFSLQGALLVSAEQPSLAHADHVAPFLLDMSPADADDTAGPGQTTLQGLGVGQAWSNPVGTMTLTVTSVDAQNGFATVTVQSAAGSPTDPGPGSAVVPNLSGKTPAGAANAITAVGLVSGTVGTVINCEELNTVVSQNPAPGIFLPLGGRVDYKYAIAPQGGCGIPQ